MKDQTHEAPEQGRAPSPVSRKADAEVDAGAAARAAAAMSGGRFDAAAPAAVLGLQRLVGNAGVTGALGDQGPAEDKPLQRAFSGDEAEAPLFPSQGEGEEDR